MAELQRPPEFPMGQDTEPPDLHQLLVVLRDMIRDHTHGHLVPMVRWLAILAVIRRVLGDDDDSS